MMRIGAHLINHGESDTEVCQSICRTESLIVGPNTYDGAGVYAYFPDRIPLRFQGAPLVVFQARPVRAMIEVAEIYIPGMSRVSDSLFFVLRGSIGTSIRVSILGFANCPGFPSYAGTLYFTS